MVSDEVKDKIIDYLDPIVDTWLRNLWKILRVILGIVGVISPLAGGVYMSHIVGLPWGLAWVAGGVVLWMSIMMTIRGLTDN